MFVLQFVNDVILTTMALYLNGAPVGKSDLALHWLYVMYRKNSILDFDDI